MTSDRDLALGTAAEYKRLADEQAFTQIATTDRWLTPNYDLANHYALQGILRLLQHQVESDSIDNSVKSPAESIAPAPRPDLDQQFVKVPVELLSSVAKSLVTLPDRHELSVDFYFRNGRGTAYIMRTEPNGYTIALSKFDWETP